MPKLFTSTLVEADTIGDSVRLYTKDPVSNLEGLRHWHGRLGDLLNELDYLLALEADLIDELDYLSALEAVGRGK